MYAAGRLWEETAYLAYYLHWSMDEIVNLPHQVRTQMISEVTRIHQQLAADPPS